MTLETERLLLRPWNEGDAESLYQYAKDPAIGPAAGWPVHTSVDNSREIIRTALSAPETYAIALRRSGEVVGCVSLKLHTAGASDLTRGADECELGYWIGRPWWGRGFMPEAARALLRRAFGELGMSRVWCAYYDGNDKSRRVQEKLGFRFQWTSENVPVPLLHETRRGHVNCLTREDWDAQEGTP